MGSALLAPPADATCANCGNMYMPLRSKMKFLTNQFDQKAKKSQSTKNRLYSSCICADVLNPSHIMKKAGLVGSYCKHM